MTITFLGTGTSQGVPVIACECNVCRSSDPKDKRLRTSVLIEVDDKTIVIDTGPDFRQQILREDVKCLDAILFTHEHKDHTAGLDDIRAFNFKMDKDMEVYTSPRVREALKRDYSYIFAETSYPGLPRIRFHDVGNSAFDCEGIIVTPVNVMHYKLPVLGFRIGDFTYITDANYIPESEMEKIKGSKVIVLNALRKSKHISHFNLEEALELMNTFKPEKGYLTHISHFMGKHEEILKELPENMELAYDGLQVKM